MKQIVKGVTNHLTKGNTSESDRRMNICLNVCKKVTEDIIFGIKCKVCGCVLKFKTKSDSSCPENKW